ncbi:3-oxoacyl-ACP synthase [Flavobacteriaceae bacterium TP-CH-4]|uniref:3-oxoacyl-ACP synthase n=1 Tax=Pelagihabitans pacificus TaxID=2696054 RepID=A0A967AV55_9FLAO|nr:3-oxoacyl-ACP synthase [Pelagihabitans pacificus]NHF60564.1 3-oxoacyl-ACP synthase [Pelagihabitans pacificus]
MMEKYHIESYCRIKDQRISLNGATVFESAETNFLPFIKEAYKTLDTQYPKFFKMDALSKLALIASDLLLKNMTEKNIALVLSNRAASLDTDRRHQQSIEEADHYYPSPAVFVYTLPNICLGEISIKHRLFSENGFFVFEQFRADPLVDYADGLLKMQRAEKVLCGWMDLDNEKYDAFLYVVAKNGIFTHSKKKINQLYQTS